MALAAELRFSTSPPALLSRVHPNLSFRPEPGPLPGTEGDLPKDMSAFDHVRHTELVEWFEASEDQGRDNREKAERDVDYYDGKQLTSTEAATLRKRGQPPVVDNRIRRKIDFLQGMERQQRTDARALPTDPTNARSEDEAGAATDALRATCKANLYDQLRSAVWADILKPGWGGIEVIVEDRQNSQNPKIVLRRCQWDRMFWDPYSCEGDFSDANYRGLVLWMDRDEAVRRYGDGAEKVFDETLNSVSGTSSYDDRPKQTTWVDHSRRKRIRVVQIYFKDEQGTINFCEFTKGGYLNCGVSPWLDEDQEPEDPYVWRSCYVDRDNNRYGIIRDMIDTQDAVNKRRSKALHLATVNQTFGADAMLSGLTVRQLRSELAKPDGHVSLSPGVEWGKNFGIIDTTSKFTAQLELLKDDLNSLDLQGPNASMQGKGPQDQSGRAILAQQQGGQLEIGPQLDTLRDMDNEVYRKIWRRIRQFWTAEEWVRITDDQRNIRFVGLNQYKRAPVMNQFTGQPMIDPQSGQPAMRVVTDPTGKPVVEKNDVGKLGVDIFMEDAPQMGQLRIESFQTMASMAKFVPGLQQMPAEAWIELSPIDNKHEVLEKLEKAREQQQQAAQQPDPVKQLQFQGAQAEVQKKQAEATAKKADAVHSIAQTKHLEVIAARDALHTAHDHADHLIDAAHGGLGPDHYIPQMANSPDGMPPTDPQNVIPFQQGQ